MKNPDKTMLNTVERKSMIVLLGTLLVLIWSSAAPGQRGIGDSDGIARQMLKPCLVRVSGKLQEIKTHPCENTTGNADLGTHLILNDNQGRGLNIHLGPTAVLSKIVERLKIGTKIEILGFRTEGMPPNQYVAKTLIFGNNSIQLRDSDLRPYWAGSGFSQVTLLPLSKTTLDRRTGIRSNCYYYSSLKSWQRRGFHNGQRPRWRRRCCRRFFCREW